MTHRDHSMDTPIVRSAFAEFLEKGFQRASLRAIAADAQVTIGAIVYHSAGWLALLEKIRQERKEEEHHEV